MKGSGAISIDSVPANLNNSYLFGALTVVGFFPNMNILPCGHLKVLDHNVTQQLRDMQIGFTSGQVLRIDWLIQDGSVSPPQIKQQKPFIIIFKTLFKLH